MIKMICKNRAALLILTVAVLCIIYGIYRNEINTVWQKASAICLECIGIG